MQTTGTELNEHAKRIALEKIRSIEHSPTSPVEYRSVGRLLIIGETPTAISIAKQLQKQLHCTVVHEGKAASQGVDIQSSRERFPVVNANPVSVDGYLGAFTVTVEDNDQPSNLAKLLGEPDGFFDLVLDLRPSPLIQREVLPPGYYAPATDQEAIDRVLTELPDLIGDFEKPRYFQYNPDICAHGASGQVGCTQCIDACPTEAIVSIGEKVEVNPYLCQGGGSCATVCPSGAMTFNYPPLNETLNMVRALARHYREAGGQTPVLLFHDAMSGRHLLEPVQEQIPGHVIPLEIEEIGATGMDTWLAAMAYGINQTVLLIPPSAPERVQTALRQQMIYAVSVIEGIGYSSNYLSVINAGNSEDLVQQLESLQVEPDVHPATFSPDYDKRTTLRMAIDHLYVHAPAQTPSAPLPKGAPFGEINVQKTACTLCMACVSVCPTSALSDGNDVPQLRFDEWNCVQCGLCESACPEEAITRNPRFVYDPEVRRRTRVLNEDEPFCCIVCGKPFATHSIMRTISNRLENHYMFQSQEAKRRMQMCEDCRVRDMFKQEAGGNASRR